MLKFFKNCIKDMYKNIFQIFSIILFVFFMTALLTGILFSNNYVWNQFQSISSKIEPNDRFDSYENLNFNTTINEKPLNLFWKNMIYVNYDSLNNKYSLDKEKFNLATLKIVKITSEDEKEIINSNNYNYFQNKSEFIYKIIYSQPDKNINIGYDIDKKNDPGYFYIDSTFYNNTGKNDFNYIKLFAKYANLDPFRLITTDNEQILEQLRSENIEINRQVLEEHKRLYWAIIISLFYERIEICDELIINDLLASGKTYYVKKFTRYDLFERPFVTKIKDNTFDFDKKNYGFIFEQFALKNNLKLNDEINIGSIKVIISGYAVHENYVYFILPGRAFPNLLDTTVVWINEKTYDEINKNLLSSIKKENKSLFGYIRNSNTKLNMERYFNISNFFSAFKDYGQLKQFDLKKPYNINSQSLTQRLNIINSIALAFSILLVTITITIIFILLFKIIVRNSGILGVIKAFGGSMKGAALNLSFVASLPVFIASLSGSVMGLLVMYFLNSSYRDFFILPKYGVEYNWLIAAGVIFIPLMIIFIISFFLSYLILKKSALVLLNQHFKIFNHIKFFSNFAIIKWKWVSYKTKITWSFMIKSISMILLTLFIAISSSALLYFTLSTNEMSTNLLERQWQGINFKYGYTYKQYDNSPYKFKNKKDLNIKNNIYFNLINDYFNIFKNKNYNLMGKWIKSSELKILINNKKIKLNNGTLVEVPANIIRIINKEQHLIKYFTGQNNNKDLIITFGNVLYDDFDGLIWNANTLDIFALGQTNNKQFINYDNILKWGMSYYSMNSKNLKYLLPNLAYNNEKFFDFSLEKWEKEEKNIINYHKNQLNELIKEGYTYKIIPAAVSRNYAYYGQLIYPELKKFQHYREKNKQIILHYVYDYIENLQNSIIVPQKIFQTYFNLSDNYFNTKLVNASTKEFQTYFTFINNNYNLFINGNFNANGWENAISGFIDIENNKQLSESFNTSINILIKLFGIFAVIIAFSIIFVVCNIILKENSHFINVFRVLGYSKKWISSLFWTIFIPIIIISAFIAIFIAEPLINILISIIFIQTGILFPIIFYWWFYLVVFITILGSFIIAFSFSWFLTLKRLKLSNVNLGA